jgi:hypothetical protein
MLTNVLAEHLEEKNISLARFQEITCRLYASNILVRREDATEARLYDDARRIEAALTEYLSLAGLRLVHDSKNEFLRLYPPGAAIPGYADDGNEPVVALRAKFTPDFVAAALALRFMFQQGFAEGGGRLSSEGEVLVRFEELAMTLQTQLKRPLPETVTERTRLLADLKRQRLVHVSPSFSMADEDALIAIRPVILGIISEDMLQAALEAGESPAQPEEPAEQPEQAERAAGEESNIEGDANE